MKIIGLTRIRNEESIIKDTLDHMAEFCDEVYVFDDASEDNTISICKNHPIVKGIIENKNWQQDREHEEFSNRQELLVLGQKNADFNDWFVYMDADERIEFDWSLLATTDKDAVVMKLFDFYITEEDKDLDYTHRKWIGPEYREILFSFRNNPNLIYHKRDQREVSLPKDAKILKAGFVKHYGKAISIQQWEETCDYYANYFNDNYKEKWLARKGKAIHTVSDFNKPLITWNQKETLGIPLVDKYTKKKNFIQKLENSIKKRLKIK